MRKSIFAEKTYNKDLFKEYLNNPVKDYILSIQEENLVNAQIMTLIGYIESCEKKEKITQVLTDALSNLYKNTTIMLESKTKDNSGDTIRQYSLIKLEEKKRLASSILYYFKNHPFFIFSSEELNILSTVIIDGITGYNKRCF